MRNENKLFADFLGIKSDRENCFDCTNFEQLHIEIGQNTPDNRMCTMLFIYDLKFHSDWNQLMLVVEKIQSQGMFFTSSRWLDDEGENLDNGYWCTIQEITTMANFADSETRTFCPTLIGAYFEAFLDYVTRHKGKFNLINKQS